uniref:Uncharacterized protein n=1 Tax=Arundo donax TaxID=35708 RepID=A0A0A8YMU5_ARUDO
MMELHVGAKILSKSTIDRLIFIARLLM